MNMASWILLIFFIRQSNYFGRLTYEKMSILSSNKDYRQFSHSLFQIEKSELATWNAHISFKNICVLVKNVEEIIQIVYEYSNISNILST